MLSTRSRIVNNNGAVGLHRLRPLAVFVGTVVVLCLFGLWGARSQIGALRRVTNTTEEGININPSLSGDGRRIAFESTEDVAHAGGRDFFRAIRADVTGDPPSFVQMGATRAPAAGISQDGSRIAFASKEDPLGTNGDGNSEIFLFDGTTLRQITNTTPNDAGTRTRDGNFQPSLTDDGRFIAFSSNRNLAGQNGDGNLEIFVLDTNSNSFAQLTNTTGAVGASDAKISGDAARVAYIRDVNAVPAVQRDLVLQDRTGGTTRIIAGNVTNLALTYGRAISDDGSRVVFSGDIATDSSQVFLFDGRTTNATRQITALGVRTTEVPLHPTISGDGTRIAFATRRPIASAGANSDNSIELYTYDVPTGQFARVTTAPSTADGFSGSTRLLEVVSSLNDDGSIVAFNFPRVMSGAVTSGFENNSEIYVTGTTPRPTVGSLTILNEASFGHEPSTTKAISPDSRAVALGGALAFRELQAERGTDGNFPTTLDGTTVTVNGRRAQIFYVSPTQVNFYVPPETELGTADVIVTNGEGFQSRGTVSVLRAAPGIFTKSGDGVGEAVVLNANMQGSGTFDPSDGQLRLIIFTTGVFHASQISVTAGGRALTFESVMRTPGMPGMDEVRVLVPADLRGAGTVNLVVRADNRDSNPATIIFAGNACRDIVINEVLADPPDGLPGGDANRDGARDSSDDEFVELVNTTSNNIDISGYELLTRSTSAASDTSRHTFPSGTLFPARSAIVIFGGGGPNFNPNNPAFGGAQVFKASSGALSLTNAGGVVTLRESSQAIANIFSYGGSTGLSGESNQSLTRSPDAEQNVCGSFTLHSTAPGGNGQPYSPGTRVDGSPFAPGVGSLTSVTISPPSANVTVGQSAQFTAQGRDQFNRAMTTPTITFASDDTNIATVDSVSKDPATGIATATVTGRNQGVAHITATAMDGGITVTSGQSTINVFPPPPITNRVEVAPPSATINRGNTQQFNATAFQPNNQPVPNAIFTWTSSNTNIATIDQNGLATGVGVGTVTITATASDGMGGTVSGTATLHVQVPLVINEVDSDQVSTDTTEFVELYDGGAGNTSLTGLVVVFYNGSNDESYAVFDLDGLSTNANGYFTLGNTAVPGVDRLFNDGLMQNGADAVAIYVGNASDFPNGTSVTTANLIDALVYDTNDADDPGLLALLNSGQPQINEDTGSNGEVNSNQRCPNGSGGARNTSTYNQFSPTPDGANVCVVVTPPPTLTINDVSLNEGNGGPTTFTFTVTLSAPAPTGGVTFDIATADGTAQDGIPGGEDNDYVARSLAAQTIAAGLTTYTFDVTVNGDVNIEPNESFVVNVTNVSGATLGDGQGQGTIQNDDSASLSINDVSMTEGDSGTKTFTFTVSLTQPAPVGGVTFDIATADGTATVANNDYVARSLTGQSIAAGGSTYTFDVTVNGDTAVEANDTFFVNVTNVSGAVVNDGQGQGTIQNDDTALVVISQLYGGGGNSGATYTHDFIELFNRGTTPVDLTGWSVQYASSTGTTWQVTNLSGTIQPGQYYLVQEASNAAVGSPLPTPDATGTIVMAATAGKVALVSTTTALSGSCPSAVTIIDLVGYGSGASCFEGSGPAPTPSATASDHRPNNGCTDTNNNAADFAVSAPTPRNTSTPVNNCSAPNLTINDVSVAEGNAGPTVATFTVSLSAPALTGGVTFDIATQDGAATVADNDYVARTLTSQTIAAGLQTYTFDVTVNGDMGVEPNETFLVNVTNVSGANVTDGQGQGTIQNDDAANLVITQIYGGGNNGGATFQNDFVEIFNRGATTVDFALTSYSVQYASASGTFSAGNSLDLTSGSLAPGQYFLIKLAGGTSNGVALPAADATNTGINMSATDGKVALVVGTAVLSGSGCPLGSTVADFVGYGSANCSETTATAALSATKSARRTVSCTDTNNNSADFTVVTNPPAPRNTSSPLQNCAFSDLTINDVSVSEGNAGPTIATFTVSLSAPAPAGGVTLDIATQDGTATVADNDYVARSLTAQTIAAGLQTYTFDVTVNGDTNVEPSETLLVNVTNVTGANVADGQGIGTIQNDDSPPDLSINDVTVNEGNAGTTTFTFTVSLSSPALAGGVTFDIATQDDSAVAGSDYVTRSLTSQTIPAGQQTYTFDVTVNGDTLFEANESFFVNVTNVTGSVTVTDGQGVGTITNDDAQPTLAIADVAVTEGNAGTSLMTFTVTLTGTSQSTVSVNYATADSSATVANTDYDSTSGTLNFVSGDTSETFTVTINGDTNAEGDEVFFVNLSTASGATISDNQALGTLFLDDPFSIAAVNTAYTENFDVLAQTTSSTTPTAWTRAESGSAANTTYSAGTGSSTTGDTYSFGSAPSTDRALGGLRTGSLVPTIGAFYRNDTGTTITSLNVSYTGEEWRLGTASRTDRLDFQYSTDATNLTTGTWTDVNLLDFTTPNTATTGLKDGNNATNRTAIAQAITGLSIAPGATFWIRWTDLDATGSDDGLAVDDFSLTANLSIPDLTIDDVSLSEGDAGTKTFTFTVSLSQPAGAGGVTFDIATQDNTATDADNDYEVNNLISQSIAAGNSTYTFDVTVNGDTAVEPNETFFVNVSNVSGATVSDAQGVGTIQNDDAATPALSIDNVTEAEGNVGPNTFSFTVSLSSAAPAGGVTFDIATQDDTATTVNNDYVLRSLTSQTIPVGQQFYTFDVTINGDFTPEPSETFFVNVTSVVGATVSDGQGLGTITNDDGVVASADLSVTKTDTADPVAIGNDITYTITVTNGGPDAAASAVMSDTVPTNTTFRSISTPLGWTCGTVPIVGGTGPISCTNPSFTGASAFTLVVRINTSVTDGTSISNTASASSSTSDPNGLNNSATQTTLAKTPLLVISQVYGGGGNASATYTNDFIEIFNRGTTTVDFSITPYSVQYAAATSAFSTNKTDITSGILAPGKYFLIQEATGGAVGSALPTPDATGTIAMSATAGKVALVLGTTLVTAATCPGDDGVIPFNPNGSSIVDFVGYGTTANCYEGSGPPSVSGTNSNARSIIRTNSCTDTNVNSADFSNPTSAPTARNSSTAAVSCP